MTTVLDNLRSVLGVPDFFEIVSGEPVFNPAAATEYVVGALIVCIVVSSIFKILIRWCER